MVLVLTIIRRTSKTRICCCFNGLFFFIIPFVAMVTVGYSACRISVGALPARSFAVSLLQTAGN
jgi:hypothetical protein